MEKNFFVSQRGIFMEGLLDSDADPISHYAGPSRLPCQRGLLFLPVSVWNHRELANLLSAAKLWNENPVVSSVASKLGGLVFSVGNFMGQHSNLYCLSSSGSCHSRDFRTPPLLNPPQPISPAHAGDFFIFPTAD